MPIDERILLEDVMQRAPFGSLEQARIALEATLAALRSGMTDDEARALFEELGPAAQVPLQVGEARGELSPDEFYYRVAEREGKRTSLAKEQAQVVCSALAQALPEESRLRLCRQLPLLADLFERTSPPEPALGAEHLRVAPAPEHTLAAGRPGSSRPLSDARPTSSRPLSTARPELAHAHSVARSADPHADTRLSSSRGLTQEREEESLARSRRVIPE